METASGRHKQAAVKRRRPPAWEDLWVALFCFIQQCWLLPTTFIKENQSRLQMQISLLISKPLQLVCFIAAASS